MALRSLLRLTFPKQCCLSAEVIDQSQRAVHIQRTAYCTREKEMFSLPVKKVQTISPSVKELELLDANGALKFKAGQWVDFEIPGIDTIGGFSICNSPFDFEKHRILRLAVKKSPHPPVDWIHTKCQPDAKVNIRVGGDFYFEPIKAPTFDVLLLAGGIGVNPLFSIASETIHTDIQTSLRTLKPVRRKVAMLYSAKNEEELIFRNELIELSKIHPNFKLQFFLTQTDVIIDGVLHKGRMTTQDIDDSLALNFERLAFTKAFLCGPPGFVIFSQACLLNLGFPEQNIISEDWQQQT